MYNYGDAPGLRIGEIISTPVQGKRTRKIYRYGVNEDNYGFINDYLRLESYSRRDLSVVEGNKMYFWTYYVDVGSGLMPDYMPFNEQMGVRTRDFLSDPYINFDLAGSPIKYNTVTEYTDSDDGLRQKTMSTYSWGDNGQISDFIVHDYDENITYPRKFANPQNACLTPVMTSKTYYKYVGDHFEPAKKESFGYGFEEKDVAWDMPTYLHTNIIFDRHLGNHGTGDVDKYGYHDAAKNYHDYSCSVYGYGFRKYVTGAQLLYNTVMEEYTPNGTITTGKRISYEDDISGGADKYLLVRSEEITNSKNEVVKISYKYPHNIMGNALYAAMESKNILTPVIVKTDSVNGVQTRKLTTNYYQPFTDMFVPQSIEIQKGSKPSEVVATFNRYDNKGNILEQQKANDLTEVYLWGYDSHYPVAKILNTTSDIAKNHITQSILDNPQDDNTLRTHLNNLRNITDAQVVTYTYKPLVGITSQTDPNNKTSYFEYDDAARLMHIKDKDGNILKKYAYNYYDAATATANLPQWQDIAGTGYCEPCQSNNAFYTGVYKIQQVDNNPQSSTHGQTRWAIGGGSYYCFQQSADEWQPTGNYRCLKDEYGFNNGTQEKEMKCINPCSPDYNKTNWWGVAGQNTTACPLPSMFHNDVDYSGTYTKNDCVSPDYVGSSVAVAAPVGMFSSPVSIALANSAAQAYVQQQANLNGTCIPVPLSLTFFNTSSSDVFDIELLDVNTNNVLYSFHTNRSGGNGGEFTLGPILPGTYHVRFTAGTSPVPPEHNYTYTAGCGFTITDYDVAITIYNVPLNRNNSCTTLTVN